MDIALILGIACSVTFVAVLLFGLVMVVVGTMLRKTPFGINLKPVDCPHCGERAPARRKPANMRQTLWGGCTCSNCGCEFDKWGNPIEA